MNQKFLIFPHSERNARPKNHDAFGHFGTAYGDLFVIADGMGNGEAAHWAATFSVSNLTLQLAQLFTNGYSPEQALDAAFHILNREIYQQNIRLSSVDPSSAIGTTLIAALFTEQGCLIAHVGDSRAYLIGPNRFERLTSDHSVVQQQWRDGQISDADLRTHPQRHVLTQAIGLGDDLAVGIAPLVQLENREWLLLCSDGLWSGIDDQELYAFLIHHGSRSDLPQLLAQRAKAGGSKDNITFFLIGERREASSNLSHYAQNPDVRYLQKANSNALELNKENAPNLQQSAGKRPTAVGQDDFEPADKMDFFKKNRRWSLFLANVFFVALIGLTILNLRRMLPEVEDAVSTEERQHETGANYEAERERSDTDDEKIISKKNRISLLDRDDVAKFSFEYENCTQSMISKLKSVTGAFGQGLSDSMVSNQKLESKLANEVSQQINKEYEGLLYTNIQWQLYVNKVGYSVANKFNYKPDEVHFCVIDSPEENAFAVPGNMVYIFTGLLENRIQNEAQLAFVLAHELTHLKRGHVSNLELIRRSYLPSFGNKADSLLAAFMRVPFNERMEQEADQYGLQVLFSTPYSPFQAPIIVENMESGKEENEGHGELVNLLLSSHPDNAFRACILRNQIRDWWEKYKDRTVLYLGETSYKNKEMLRLDTP